jgi:hypothetical protein
MSAEPITTQQPDPLIRSLSKIFMRAVQDPGLRERLLANPEEALQTIGLTLTPEEMYKILGRLREIGQATLLDMFYLVGGVLSGMAADRILAPKPVPPPPPPVWWPPVEVVLPAMKWAKAKIVRDALRKSKPKLKAKPTAKKKVRSVAKRKKGRK